MLFMLIQGLLMLAIFGFGVWLITTLIPMSENIKQAVIGLAGLLVLVVILLWLAGAVPGLGLFHR